MTVNVSRRGIAAATATDSLIVSSSHQEQLWNAVAQRTKGICGSAVFAFFRNCIIVNTVGN